MLSWMKADALGNYHSVFWLVPVMSFSIIVGIGLDYDVFLLVRIKEARCESSVLRRGLCWTRWQ
jgi:uncharacterized membrane protein YdfJ with MMPL/SSD domain